MQQQQPGQLRQTADEGNAEKKLAAAAEEAAAAAGKERRAQVRPASESRLAFLYCMCHSMCTVPRLLSVQKQPCLWLM